MSVYAFEGTERATLELDGYFRPGGLAVPPRLQLELDADGRARVRLFAFHVDDLRIARLPLVRASYAEILWRIAVRAGDRPCWWVTACDLGARGPRLLAARYVRYPVRDTRVDVCADRIVAHGAGGDLVIAAGPIGQDAAPLERRPVITGPAGEWEVPFEDAGPHPRPALATVEADSLAEATVGMPVTWSKVAFVRTGRLHRCGVALRR